MSVHHDWGQHYLGWAFYRNEAWTFPLGTITSFNYPIGTNIGFMDSIPLLALILKPFSTVLPQDFQYLGFWLFTCTFFLAYYTRKILELYKISNWIIALSILILIANPVFLFRAIHPALSSHFLILGSIYNYIRPSFSISKKINKDQVFLFVIASTINPYLSVMVFSFNIIVPIKHYLIEKTISFKQCVFYPTLSLVLFGLSWVLIGIIEFKNGTNVASSEPFSVYSLNVNSFFDSYGYYSRLLPDLGKVDPRQYEGFAYLGLGIILLSVLSLIYSVFLFSKKRISLLTIKKWGLLLILCIVLCLFALTNVISLNDKIITTLPLPKIIEKLGFIFRASGRFVWPLYYLIFICSIIIFNKIKINSYLKHFIFLFITILQLYDTQELFLRWKLPEGVYKTPLKDKNWINVMEHFDNIIIYPPFDYNYNINYTNDYQDLSYLALKAKKPISNGYVARANIKKGQEFASNLLIELKSGIINSKRLYITTKKHFNSFDVLLNKEIVDIHLMDNFIFIYKKNVKLKSSDFKENYSTKIFLDSVKTHFKNLKLNELEPVEYSLNATKPIKYFFDTFNFHDNIVKIRGWAVLEESNNNQNETIFLLLQKNNLKFEIRLNSEERLDITTYFKKENLNNAGFNSVIFTKNLNKGTYSVGLVIKKTNGECIHIDSGRKIIIN
ncbi:MAG: hypothetical protein H7239_13220 [Flavobacterium sp.]|nr:hypothetical protein [Flavobacterium sp.]